MHWSYWPPLLVYLAAGVSGLTSIVGTFFIKEYLGLSAAFLAGLAFWAGIPWALKMPLGHLVDLIWRWKAWLVYLGAALIAGSLGIMYGLIAHTEWMLQFASSETWFVTSVLLAPIGYVLQDVVADAMTVEAVPTTDRQGRPLSEAEVKVKHTTMQTLGRFSIIMRPVCGFPASCLARTPGIPARNTSGSSSTWMKAGYGTDVPVLAHAASNAVSKSAEHRA